MDDLKLKRLLLMQGLETLPESKVAELANLMNTLESQSTHVVKRAMNLKGIWKNKGFDKIKGLEEELYKIPKVAKVEIPQ